MAKQQSETIIPKTEPYTPKVFAKYLNKVAYNQNLNQTFDDWLTLASCAYAKPVNLHEAAKIEAEYMQVVSKYKPGQVKLLTELLGLLIQAFNDPPYIDFLGLVLMDQELGNKFTGQFFTPIHVCQLMADMTLADMKVEPDKIITLDEPAVGAGACILAAVNTLQKKKFTYWSHLAVQVTDVDHRCFRMAFLQLALAGVSAVVKHGNTLSQEMWRTWYTPSWVLNRVGVRLKLQRTGGTVEQETGSGNGKSLPGNKGIEKQEANNVREGNVSFSGNCLQGKLFNC